MSCTKSKSPTFSGGYTGLLRIDVGEIRFALGGSPFTVHIYIGENTKVGSVYNFSTPAHATGGPDGCENCRKQEQAAVIATNQVPITNALLLDIKNKDKSLDTLNPDEVEKYLKENLHWKVTKVCAFFPRLTRLRET
jgi:tyrosinase